MPWVAILSLFIFILPIKNTLSPSSLKRKKKIKIKIKHTKSKQYLEIMVWMELSWGCNPQMPINTKLYLLIFQIFEKFLISWHWKSFQLWFLFLFIINPIEAENSLKPHFSTTNETLKPPISPSTIPQADIIFIDGNYLMHLSIGTPADDIYGSIDTGSDFIWTQCESCPQS